MNVNDFNGVNLDTAIFDEIIDDNSIEKLCNIINDFVPSQFSNLSDCGLFLNGLNSITSNVSSILESVKSLKTQIKVHKESIIDIENGRDVSIAQIPEINVEDNDVSLGSSMEPTSTTLISEDQDTFEVSTDDLSKSDISSDDLSDLNFIGGSTIAGVAASSIGVATGNAFSFGEADKTPSITQQNSRLEEIRNVEIDGENKTSEPVANVEEASVSSVSDKNISSFGEVDKTPSTAQQSARLEQIRNVEIDGENQTSEPVANIEEASVNPVSDKNISSFGEVDKTPSTAQQSARLEQIRNVEIDGENKTSESVANVEEEASVSSVSDKNISSFGVADKTPSAAQQSARLEEIRNVEIDGENKTSEPVVSTDQEASVNSVSDKNISSFGVADKTPSAAQQSSRLEEIRNVEIDGENKTSEPVVSIDQEASVNSVSDKNISSFGVADKTPSTAQQSARLEEIRNVEIDGEKQTSEPVANVEEEASVSSVSDKNISSFGVADKTPSTAQQNSRLEQIRNVEIDGETQKNETVISAEEEASVNPVSDKNISSFGVADKTPSIAQQNSRLEEIRNVEIDGENKTSETVVSTEEEAQESFDSKENTDFSTRLDNVNKSLDESIEKLKNMMENGTIKTTDSINIDDVSDMPAKPVINSNIIDNTNVDPEENADFSTRLDNINKSLDESIEKLKNMMADETIETTDSMNIDDVIDMPAKPVRNSNVIKNTNFDSKTNYGNNNINNSHDDFNSLNEQFINNSFENVTNADVEINNPSEELSNDTALPNQEYNDFINNEQNVNINITNKPSDNLGITNENISEQEPFGPGNNPIHTDTNSNDSIDDDFTPPIIGDMNNSDINEPTIDNSQEIPSDDSIDLDKINGENNIIDENTALKDENPENIVNTPNSDNIHITDDNKSNNFRNVIIGGLGAAAAGAIGITAMRNKEKGDRDEN